MIRPSPLANRVGSNPGSRVYTDDGVVILAIMDTVTSEVTTRELRAQLADVLGRAMYAGERIGVTRNGKLAAVVIGVDDLEALEEFEMAQDLAAYREAKAADDGGRVTLDELRRGLAP
jgi:prevent-host-death family protein